MSDHKPVHLRLVAGDRVLLINQPTRRRRFWAWLTRKPIPNPNGIYEVTSSSWPSWNRQDINVDLTQEKR